MIDIGIPATAVLAGVVVAMALAFLQRIAERAADKVNPGVIGRVAKQLWAWLEPYRRGLVMACLAGALVAVGVAVGKQLDGGGGRPDDNDTAPTTIATDIVEVMVVWEGRDLANFREVVAAYNTGVDEYPDVVVTPVGLDIGAALDERFEAGNPPDVAIVPQPGLVWRYAAQDRLAPLPVHVTERFPDQWNTFTETTDSNGVPNQYGAIMRATHKSLFWYQPESLGEPPEDWSWGELTEWLRNAPERWPDRTPLTIAGGDEWPLTDWFENELVALDPDLYDQLASGCETDWDQPEVTRALSDMADVWNIPGVFGPGGPEQVRETRRDDLIRRVAEDEAALAFGPSFIAGAVEDLPEADRPRPFGFPAVEGVRPLVVGGTIAMVPRQQTPSAQGQDLVNWLTNDEALRRWAEVDNGFLTPSVNSPHWTDEEQEPSDGDDVRVLLTSHLHPSADERLHFDLSDQFGVVRHGNPRVTWEILVDFFDQVTSDRSREQAAIEEAIDGFKTEAQSGSWAHPNCDD